MRGLGNAEINDFGNRTVIMHRDHDIGGLDIPVDNSLLMCVLNRTADIHKQFQPRPHIQLVLIAKFSDRDTPYQLHHEKGSARVGCAGIQNLRNIGVLHHRKGLSLGLKSSDDLFGIHAQLDDFQRHTSCDRLLLLCHVDHPTTSFADILKKFVSPDDGALGFRKRCFLGLRWIRSWIQRNKVRGCLMRLKQVIQLLSESWLILAGLGKKVATFGWVIDGCSLGKQFFEMLGMLAHDPGMLAVS